MNPEPLPTATRTLSPETVQKYMLALNELASTLSIYSFKPIDVSEFCKRHDIKPSFFDALRDLNKLELDLTKGVQEGMFFKMDKELYAVTPDEIVAQMRRNGHKTAKKQAEATFEAIKEVTATNFNDLDAMAKGVELMKSAEEIETAKANCVAGPNCSTSVCMGCSGSIGKSHLNITAEEAQQIMQEAETFEQIEAAQVKPVPNALKDWSADSRLEPRLLSRPYKISLKADSLELTMEVNTTEDSDILDAVLFKLNRESLSVVLK
ncbi:hypothetical protein [Spirosoma oryzicola]|uniref:hypothetical protein n=1 Tax=Spirosoma oryzicola TaxID=2898794 RepID=UPI001E4379FD|nr:hypothetical protein [Spirosoma oryzicola]UHG93225.1 hypothetical protein LQ777_10070 [Spirosoma oryzicola]